jgi:hypothetical protein
MKGPMVPQPIAVPDRRMLAGVAASAVLATCLAAGVPLPVLATAIVVTTSGDPPLASTNCPAAANPCSVRAAVAQANALGGVNVISFAVDGVFKVTSAAGGQIEIKNSVPQHLTIAGNGAAKTILDGQGEDHRILFIDSGATVALSGMTFRNAHGLHGFSESGAAMESDGILTLTGVAVTGNTLEGSGRESSVVGAGIAALGPLTVVNSTISNNVIRADVTGNNSAAVIGAGIFVTGYAGYAPLVVQSSVVSGNSINISGAGAGGLFGGGAGIGVAAGSSASTSVTVDSSTISGNSIADHSTGTRVITGGGMDADAGMGISISNSTVDGNSVSSDAGFATGGGIAIGTGGATLTNVTVSGNSAASGSSLSSGGDTVRVRSSIFSNAGPGGCSTPYRGIITSLGDNLDSGSSCGLSQTTDHNGLDPILGPLQDNGGPTPTRALLPGSPAIDAVKTADCPPPATDQRGVRRPQGPACDIGAFEVQQDYTSPVLQLPANITANAAGPQGAVVNYEFSAADPDDLVTSSSCAPASGSLFVIGTTAVNCTATDSHANVGTGSFMVSVKSADLQLSDLYRRVQGVGPGDRLADLVHLAQTYVRSADGARACQTLSRFANSVHRLRRRLSPNVSTRLMTDATRIRAVIGC